MATKAKTLYVCSACGHESVKWFGCCPGCGEWNTMDEVFKTPKKQKIPAGLLRSALPPMFK